MNRYTNRERAAVKSVVVDLNAQYIKFIKALFPNARIIIDRFHIVQLVGRALGNARISLMKKDERLPLQGIQDTEGTLASVSQGFR